MALQFRWVSKVGCGDLEVGPWGYSKVCRKMRNSYISLLFLIKVRKLNRNYVWTLVFFFKRVQLTCQVLFLLNWHPQFYCNSKTPLVFFTVISKHSTYIKKISLSFFLVLFSGLQPEHQQRVPQGLHLQQHPTAVELQHRQQQHEWLRQCRYEPGSAKLPWVPQRILCQLPIWKWVACHYRTL